MTEPGTLFRKPTGLFDRIERWLTKNEKTIFYVVTGLCVLLSIAMFNARISEAHDDALYLEGGWRYVHEFPNYFYTQNAPLYVLFLGLMIKVFGFKLILMKCCSLLFNLFGLIFFYKALRGKVPAAVFLPVLIFQAVNHLVLYYASMTFTEAFYFFLQGYFFLQAVRITALDKSLLNNFSASYKVWLMLGLSMFLMSTAKSAAIVVIPALVLFFVLEKNWKAAGFSVLAYAIFKLPYEILVRAIWGSQNQFSGQGKILLQKDPYDKALGNEDLSGFIGRLFENTNLSLSKRFYQIIGWMSEDNTDVNWLVTIITLGLMLYGFWRLFKIRNRPMVLIALFTGAQLVLSYLILQVRWDQPRITLVLMPVMLILIFYAIYEFTNREGFGQVVFLVLAITLCGSVLGSTLKRAKKNLPIVQKNLKGDKYFGYTPDWQNFLRCSEWCADSLPENTLVVSRKAPMSFVYGKGKKFFPVYSVIFKDTATNQSNPDSALAFFKRNGVTHVMLAHLRMNPNAPGNGFINTVHNILYPIAVKYPQKVQLVHAEGLNGMTVPRDLIMQPANLIAGGGEYEECYLYQLNY